MEKNSRETIGVTWRISYVTDEIDHEHYELQHCSTKERGGWCRYNVTPWRVRATILVVLMQWALHNLSVCVFSLRYPACNTHAPYYHVARLALQYFSTLSHILVRHDFREKVIEHKICVSSLSETSVWNMFHSKNKWARYGRKCTLVFM
jgi:hypothetical protein